MTGVVCGLCCTLSLLVVWQRRLSVSSHGPGRLYHYRTGRQ
eukprot:COSAG06_NODE_2721_length_6387_cov_3.702449_9_plen_40_part_01